MLNETKDQQQKSSEDSSGPVSLSSNAYGNYSELSKVEAKIKEIQKVNTQIKGAVENCIDNKTKSSAREGSLKSLHESNEPETKLD